MCDNSSSENKIEFSQLYTEAGHFLRHYSISSRTVRVLAIVQGLVIITGSAYMIQKQEFLTGFLISIFGLTFTFFLFLLHDSYLAAAKSFYDTLIFLEKEASLSDFGPMNRYQLIRNQKLKRKVDRFFRLHSTFTLIGITFFVLAIYCGYWLI